MLKNLIPFNYRHDIRQDKLNVREFETFFQGLKKEIKI